MRLQTYLNEQNLSHAQFASKLAKASEFAVRKWARGERVPRPESMREIEKVTGGKVSPADFILGLAA